MNTVNGMDEMTNMEIRIRQLRCIRSLDLIVIIVVKYEGFQIQSNVFAGVAGKNELNKLTQDLWHFRLGHLNVFDMRRMVKYNMVKGIENVEIKTDDKFCESCVVSKHARS